jgi:hypothetical protein
VLCPGLLKARKVMPLGSVWLTSVTLHTPRHIDWHFFSQTQLRHIESRTIIEKSTRTAETMHK